MVSFRFHLVSLIGMFLALGIGIAVGATVVDRATVTLLEDRVEAVGRRAEQTNAQNDRLRAELDRWEKFVGETGDELVEGRLTDVDVLLVGVRGVDRDPVARMRQSLAAAGARLRGTVWLTGKLRLEEPAQVQALADALGVTAGPADADADLVRRAAIDRMAAALAGTVEGSPLLALRDGGFVDLEPPEGGDVDLVTVPSAQTRFVVVSGAKPDIPNDKLGTPFAAALAERAPLRVLAAEPAPETTDRAPVDRALFVGPLRADDETSGRLSTVDNLESYRGRVAAVLAVADLGLGKVGHYGVGPGASRMAPEPAPA